MGFKFNVSSNNEITVPLDFKIQGADYDNLKAEKPMEVVLKRVNNFILQDKSFETSIDKDGTVSSNLNKIKYIKQVFVRFNNPLSITIDDGEERDIVLEDIIEHYEFSELLTSLFIEASKIATGDKDKGAKTKKS